MSMPCVRRGAADRPSSTVLLGQFCMNFFSVLLNRLVLAVFLSLILFLSGAGAGAEDKEKTHGVVEEFSADVVRREPKGNQGVVSRGKMYVGQHGVRTEGEREGQQVWMIYKPAEKRVLVLLPQQKIYSESVGVEIARPPMPNEPESPCRKDPQFVCREQGRQVMGGRETRLWDIFLRSREGGVKPYARMWVDGILKIAIRELYADGLEVTLENVRQGLQAKELFEVSEDFKRVDLPVAGGGGGKK
ncbi:MAG: hypothetical protein H7829_07345 [Magnetococcus sp. THC-1_WYH]